MVVSSCVLGSVITKMINTIYCNRFPRKTWPAGVLWRKRRRSSKLVCEACKKNGVIPTDLELYTCQYCQHQLGNKHFNKGLLKDHKYHGRKRLVCTKCNEISAQRGKLLQRPVPCEQSLLQMLLPYASRSLSFSSSITEATMARV